MIPIERWREHARCLGMDVNVFYRTSDSDEALRVCWGVDREGRVTEGECPVRVDCLHAALDARDAQGVQGGLTPEERWQLLGGVPE